jgi:hypothetical protein
LPLEFLLLGKCVLALPWKCVSMTHSYPMHVKHLLQHGKCFQTVWSIILYWTVRNSGGIHASRWVHKWRALFCCCSHKHTILSFRKRLVTPVLYKIRQKVTLSWTVMFHNTWIKRKFHQVQVY